MCIRALAEIHHILLKWLPPILFTCKLFHNGCEAQVCVCVLFEFVHTAVDQTYIYFCPLSQVISSPHISVNAYRDTVQHSSCWSEGRSRMPSGKVLKLASYYTPAGINSRFPACGQLWASWIKHWILQIHRILSFSLLFILLFWKLIHLWWTLVHWPLISWKNFGETFDMRPIVAKNITKEHSRTNSNENALTLLFSLLPIATPRS